MKSIYTPEYRALIEWLRKCRTARKLTMRDVAAKLDVPHSWIGKIETGERRLDVAEFVRLCRVLDVDPHAGMEIVNNQIPYPVDTTAKPALAAESCATYRARRQSDTIGKR